MSLIVQLLPESFLVSNASMNLQEHSVLILNTNSRVKLKRGKPYAKECDLNTRSKAVQTPAVKRKNHVPLPAFEDCKNLKQKRVRSL